MRSALRRAWSVDDSQIVVALVGDTPRAMDAMRGLTAAGLAAETGRTIRLLVHPEAHHRARAQRVADAMGRTDRLIHDDRVVEPAAALAGADLVLALAGCGEQAIGRAMAHGLAIICDHECDLLDNERTALVTGDRSDRALAGAIRRLHDDPALRQRLGRAAAEAVAAHPHYRRLTERAGRAEPGTSGPLA